MPYAIIVYDVEVKRQNKVRELLRRFLFHVQNSVFEGNIKESDIYYLEKLLKKIINEEKDSVFIYILPSNTMLKKIEIGKKFEPQIL